MSNWKSHFKIITLHSHQKGAVLIGLIITMTVVAVLSAALVYFTTTSTFSEFFANRQERAYYIAESGARYAIPQIKADPVQAATDLHGKAFTLINGDKFLLLINTTDPNATYLESEGVVHEGDWLESRARITYKIPKTFRFDYGLFSGNQQVVLKDRAYIDSYDSRVGPWSSEGAIRNGIVGTNRTGKNSIRVRKNAKVYGDAEVGPGGDPSKDIAVEKNALLTGSKGTLSAAKDMTPLAMPAGGGTPFDLNLDNNDTYTFTDGIYRLNTIEITDDGILTISVNVTLYVEDNIRMEDRGEIDILPGGSLTIYAAAELIVKQDAKINATEDPEKLIIFGTATFSKVQFTDNAYVRGAVYAPLANAQIQKNAEIFGSVITRKVTIEDDAMFHYDEALGGGVGIGGRTIQYF